MSFRGVDIHAGDAAMSRFVIGGWGAVCVHS
jgi:hypothetical protein